MAHRIRGEPLFVPAWPEGSTDAGHADQRYWAGLLPDSEPLSAETYQGAVRDLVAALVSLDAGGGGLTAFRAARAGLDLPEPPPLCHGRPESLGEDAPALCLERVSADLDPSLGEDAPGVLLGPWLGLLDRRRSAHRRAMLAALGAAAFTMPATFNRTPLRGWLRERPRPSAAARRGASVITRVPFAPWRLVEGDGERWEVAPVLPLKSWWCPQEPISLRDAGWVDTGPARGGVLFARLVPAPEGWRAITPLVLPSTPSADWWRGVYARHMVTAQAENRSLRLEDVLRRRGHWLCREAHIWWWVQRLEGAR